MEITSRQLVHGYRGAHQRLREVIDGLTSEQLNWSPHPAANSIAVLVMHTLGSERWNLRAVRGLDNPRDREAEFSGTASAPELLKRLDQADAELAEHVGAIDSETLGRSVRMADSSEQPALHLLLANTGHAREHTAQAELTRQLAKTTARGPSSPTGGP